MIHTPRFNILNIGRTIAMAFVLLQLGAYCLAINDSLGSNEKPKKTRPLGKKLTNENCASLLGGLIGAPPDQNDPGGIGSGGENPNSSISLSYEQRKPVLASLSASLQNVFHYPSLSELTSQKIPQSQKPVLHFLDDIPQRLESVKSQHGKNAQLPPATKEALTWLEKSIAEDLASADILMTANNYGTSCYHAQQAAEKSLKGVLIHFGVADAKLIKKHGHNLDSLLEHVKKDVPNPEAAEWITLATAVAKLTPLATRYRYPDPNVSPPTPQEAQNAIDLAKLVVGLSLTAMEPKK